MKNSYPVNSTASKVGTFSSPLYYSLSGAAVLLLMLNISGVISDIRFSWAALAVLTCSVVIYPRITSPAVKSRQQSSQPEQNTGQVPATSIIEQTKVAPVVNPTLALPAPQQLERTQIAPGNIERTQIAPANIERTQMAPGNTIERTRIASVAPEYTQIAPANIAERTMAVPGAKVNPVVAQQMASRFMTPEEWRGEKTVEENTPQPGRSVTREELAVIIKDHNGWLERGALPEAAGRAVLLQANMENMNLRGVVLVRANLSGSTLIYASLSEANFSGATLCNSDLSAADMRGTDLRETDLRECRLCEADMRGADLRGAELIQSLLAGANLSGADMSEAYLSGADLTGADLSGAKMDGAYLSGALLLGTDLTGVSLEGIDLRRARYDSRTKWPAGFEPRRSGATPVTTTTGGETTGSNA